MDTAYHNYMSLHRYIPLTLIGTRDVPIAASSLTQLSLHWRRGPIWSSGPVALGTMVITDETLDFLLETSIASK